MNKSHPLKPKRNVPVLTFLMRTWLLGLFTIGLNCAPLWNHAFFYVPSGADEWGNTVWRGVTAFEIIGAPIYIPGILLLTWWLSAFAVHLYYRETIDADAHNGSYLSDWRTLTPEQRVKCTTIARAAAILAGALIAASVVK